MTTNPNIQIITSLARDLMDGQQPPPAGPKLQALEKAVRELLKHDSVTEFELLGRVLLGTVIDRIDSTLKAQATLERFIRGADDCY